MNKYIKLLFIVLVSFNMVFGSVVNEVCNVISESSYFPVGDELGNTVFTQQELTEECNTTISALGACKTWKDQEIAFNLGPSSYDTYRSQNHAGAMGSLLAMLGAYDQLSHLWSGWKGYCEYGTKIDFDWASDPMFWSSLVMSSVMDGQGKDGLFEDTMLDMTSVNESVGSAWHSLGTSIGLDLSVGFGVCLVGAGVDISKDLYGYFSEDDPIDCDPIDEFCDEDGKEVSEGEVSTLTRTQYDDIITKLPEAVNYIEILDDGASNEGVMTIRMKPASDIPAMDVDSQKAMEEARQAMKDMQFLISSLMTVAKMATCAASSGNVAPPPSNSSDPGNFSVKNGIGMAVNSLPTSWLGPYGTLIKAALSVALEVLDSFKSIDSCTNEDDAAEAGTRHKKTFESLPYNLCKLTKKSCAQQEIFGSGCSLDAKTFCCYDQPLTKSLVVQIKGQLGRDWQHCTGISLDDLKLISFRECSDSDKSTGFNVANEFLIYNADGELTHSVDWTQSYQYKKKCIDMTEFKEELQKNMNTNIDFSDFDDMLSSVNK